MLLFGGRLDFSAGLDYSQLDEALLNRVLQLAVQLASQEKPLFSFVEGEIRGTAVALLAHTELVYATPEARFFLDNVEQGWLPDAGASYFLSRTQHCLGRYLFLTSAELDHESAHLLGLTRGTIWCDPRQLAESLFVICEVEHLRKNRDEDLF